MRRLTAITLAGVAAFAAACGGEPAVAPAPLGSPENPAKAERVEPGRDGEPTAPREQQEPGYQALVEGQTKNPRERFTPCNLVTAAQARAILGAPIQAPLEAPQGPTCIYRSRKGNDFVTLSVQATDFGPLKRSMAQRRQLQVSARTAYCGFHGQPMLYLPLDDSRVLSIAARCSLARQFAAKAVLRLAA